MKRINLPFRKLGLAICIVGSILASSASAQDAKPAKVPQNEASFQALQTYVAGLKVNAKKQVSFCSMHMPESDRKTLPLTLFQENLEQAYIAREQYPWTKALPKERFFNEVLPYAVIDEVRDPWRKRLRELFQGQIKDSETVRDVAQVVGSEIVKLTGVKYNTKREKACQSPAESIRQGMASCTGLSILMVDSSAPVVSQLVSPGIPLWGTLEGNHTWIEIHDGKQWNMSDYGSVPKEWNKGWAIDRCAYCDPARPIHGVFATSYQPTKIMFPLIWDWRMPRSARRGLGHDQMYAQQRDADGKLSSLKWVYQKTWVSAVDRTADYIAMAGGRKIPIPKGKACVAIRAYLSGTNTRVDIPVRVKSGGKIIFEGRTASESQDLNDFVRIICEPGDLTVEYQTATGDWKSLKAHAAKQKETPVKIEVSAAQGAGVFSIEQRRALATWFRSGGAAWPTELKWPTPKSPEQIAKMRATLWSIFREAARGNRYTDEFGALPAPLSEVLAKAKKEGGIRPRVLTTGKHKMPFVLLRKETKPVPARGRALYICLHGGGNFDKAPGPHAWNVNTREWQSQMQLAAGTYAGEGIFFVPRMADDRRGRWWYAHNLDAFDWLISHAIREWNVDPNKVYLMGVSEGCYGTQIDGPFMADRFAAANAMAGGVGNDVPAENLSNLPFRTDVGENDTTFDRVGLARKYHARMDAARKKFGGAYINHLEVQKGRGHGVDYQPGSQWMIKYTRKPKPDTIVWKSQLLDKRRRPAFYWIGMEADPSDGQAILVVAKLDKKSNSVNIEVSDADGKPLAGRKLSVMLDQSMLDLSNSVTIVCNGKQVYQAVPKLSVESLARTMLLRSDPELVFPVVIPVVREIIGDAG